MEVLIVLAVSSAMFLTASVAFRGRQQQVQFNQSVRDFENVMLDIINDVSTGYYPSNSQVSCSVTPITANRPFIASDGNAGLGTNGECIYVGKAIQFVQNGLADKETKFNVYTMAGKRYLNKNSQEPADSVADVLPVAVPSTKETLQTRYGIKITKVIEVVNPSTVIEYGVLVLLSNFDGSNLANAVSQGQSIKVAGIKSASTKLNATEANAVALINSTTESSAAPEGYININPPSGITICLDDDEGRKASITLGGSSGQGTVLRIGDYITECD